MIDPAKKTVIFDFGNVLINLDYRKTFDAFHKVLGIDFSKGLPKETEQALHRYEKGEINTESFLWVLQQFNSSAPILEVIDAWNSILGELPLSRLELVKSLQAKYNLAILSNINELHEKAIDKRLENVLRIKDFKTAYFNKIYYSHHIGMRKPDIEIYNFVANDLGAKASDILFIDDLSENVKMAQKAGWNAVQHSPNEDIMNNIDNYLSNAFG